MRQILCIVYYVFAFTALVFEPLYYFGCSWHDVNDSCGDYIIAKIWRIYTQWDPIFLDVPLFLRIMCLIECFIFGPSYLFCALQLSKKKTERSTSFLPFAFVFNGALIYSTLVYFAYEVLHEMKRGANMPMVFLINIPWTVFPILLCVYLAKEKETEEKIIYDRPKVA